ncbi:hypothetical protein ADL28_13455 [Streptomyces violaceusniger]|uniref:Secreted protein n=1 Tax=Streptomyces violaceusniger TaxID=68280 RepID=A0A0X3WZL3_STRVO|nr:hypothetical protein ADL28_13455 [Streptomyces violaceusniger]
MRGSRFLRCGTGSWWMGSSSPCAASTCACWPDANGTSMPLSAEAVGLATISLLVLASAIV